jgi:DNA-binding response OmpR family regulator
VIEDRGLRVLIADDEPAIRDVLALLLETEGFETQAVANGREACIAARAVRPDLLLLDVMMPEQDGLSALRELKADPATNGIPVLMISALSTSRDLLAAEEAGAAGYLAKPFRSDDLLDRIHAVLEQRTSTAAAAVAPGCDPATPPGDAPTR